MTRVLIENFEDGFLYGHSENYIPVKITGKPNEVNKIIPVELIHIEDGEVMGERQTWLKTPLLELPEILVWVKPHLQKL